MVPAPTGLPTIVMSMPRAAFCSIIPATSPRLGGIGNRFSSSGGVTWPCTSMIMTFPSSSRRTENLAAVAPHGRDHVAEVGEGGRVELRHLQAFGRCAGVEEPAGAATGRAGPQPARDGRLHFVRVRKPARGEHRGPGARGVQHAADLDAD